LSSIRGMGWMVCWAHAAHSATITATLIVPIHFVIVDKASSRTLTTRIGPWSNGARKIRALS